LDFIHLALYFCFLFIILKNNPLEINNYNDI